MEITILKSLAKSSLFIVSALLVFTLLHPAISHALSCAAPLTSFIAVCEKNSCKEGFAIQYRGTGNMCDSRPVVVESGDIEKGFSFVSQKLNIGTLNGIYQLKTSSWCLQKWEDEYCPGDTSIEKLSDNATLAQLNTLKSEWQIKEQQAARDVETKKWTTVLIIIVVALFAIFWPWILLLLKKNIKHVSSLFILAIITQVIVAFSLYGSFMWSFALWQSIASISSLVLLASAVFEIGYLVYRKIRARKLNIS